MENNPAYVAGHTGEAGDYALQFDGNDDRVRTPVVINLGSNFEISIGDTAALIAEVMQAEININTDGRRMRPKDSEVERLWADNTRAKELLNWSPEYGRRQGFKRALAETALWFSDPVHLQRYAPNRYQV